MYVTGGHGKPGLGFASALNGHHRRSDTGVDGGAGGGSSGELTLGCQRYFHDTPKTAGLGSDGPFERPAPSSAQQVRVRVRSEV